MAEALAILILPHGLQVAQAALSVAWQQYEKLASQKMQCKTLISRSQSLLVSVGEQIERPHLQAKMQNNLYVLEDVCISVRDLIKDLTKRNFAWRILHQDKTDKRIMMAEKRLEDAFRIFDVAAHIDGQRLQVEIATEMARASQEDQAELNNHLEKLSGNDVKILEALQGSHLRLDELLTAMTKHVQSTTDIKTQNVTPTERFIRTAVQALRRLSKEPQPSEIVSWQVTSLEITFDPEDKETKIGQGSFGNVYIGEWHGDVVAVKEMYSESAGGVDAKFIKAVKNEIKIWNKLNHPRIAPFYGACLETLKPFMVTKYCKNGNVLNFLTKRPEANRLQIVLQVCFGMAYLHGQSVVHSDLKGANILIADDEKALISDFGISRFRQEGSYTSQGTLHGTLRWMAPELFEGQQPDPLTDVYSFGITAWEIYTLEVPFYTLTTATFMRRVVDKRERPQLPLDMSAELQLAVKQCWAHERTERPSFEIMTETLKHLSRQETEKNEKRQVTTVTFSDSDTTKGSRDDTFSVEIQMGQDMHPRVLGKAIRDDKILQPRYDDEQAEPLGKVFDSGKAFYSDKTFDLEKAFDKEPVEISDRERAERLAQEHIKKIALQEAENRDRERRQRSENAREMEERERTRREEEKQRKLSERMYWEKFARKVWEETANRAREIAERQKEEAKRLAKEEAKRLAIEASERRREEENARKAAEMATKMVAGSVFREAAEKANEQIMVREEAASESLRQEAAKKAWEASERRKENEEAARKSKEGAERQAIIKTNATADAERTKEVERRRAAALQEVALNKQGMEENSGLFSAENPYARPSTAHNIQPADALFVHLTDSSDFDLSLSNPLTPADLSMLRIADDSVFAENYALNLKDMSLEKLEKNDLDSETMEIIFYVKQQMDRFCSCRGWCRTAEGYISKISGHFIPAAKVMGARKELREKQRREFEQRREQELAQKLYLEASRLAHQEAEKNEKEEALRKAFQRSVRRFTQQEMEKKEKEEALRNAAIEHGVRRQRGEVEVMGMVNDIRQTEMGFVQGREGEEVKSKLESEKKKKQAVLKAARKRWVSEIEENSRKEAEIRVEEVAMATMPSESIPTKQHRSTTDPVIPTLKQMQDVPRHSNHEIMRDAAQKSDTEWSGDTSRYGYGVPGGNDSHRLRTN